MKKYIKISLSIMCCFFFISCEDYLDIQPEDKYLESDVYKSELGIQNILNGIYISLTSRNLYGENLTTTTIELLAQRYNIATSDNLAHFKNYSYQDKKAKSTFESIWQNQYITILNLNKLLTGLETYTGVLSSDKEAIIKGEAYGLRAMLHFDLLRLFGPIYQTNSSEKAIPYYKKASTDLAPIVSASDVVEQILDDLSKAEELLADDAIISNGIPKTDRGFPELSSDFYTGSRNYRLNYYAIKALQARVLLYSDKKVEALIAAKQVIDQASNWFPWTKPEKVISAGGSPDRLFSTEVIFALYNRNVHKMHDKYFSESLNDKSILAPTLDRLDKDVYESNLNDYRYSSSWKVPTTGGKAYKTFFKFDEILDAGIEDFNYFQHMQPLIRMSEMYYIAAECETDKQTAIDYLNIARYNRGLVDLPLSADLEKEIFKEYQKEFYGEGQLFFYFKRNNIGSILNGSAGGSISMSSAQYVIPLPESESNYRN